MSVQRGPKVPTVRAARAGVMAPSGLKMMRLSYRAPDRPTAWNQRVGTRRLPGAVDILSRSPPTAIATTGRGRVVAIAVGVALFTRLALWSVRRDSLLPKFGASGDLAAAAHVGPIANQVELRAPFERRRCGRPRNDGVEVLDARSER